MFKLAFWKALMERAVSTAAQSALTAIGMGAINAIEADWPTVGGFALGGFVLSVLKGLGANVISGGPSFAPEAEVKAARG